MADMTRGSQHGGRGLSATGNDGLDEATTVADLATMLNKAYLSGDGAAVERVMALMAATMTASHEATSRAA